MSPAWMHMFLRTASQSCFFQDLLLAACHYCDHFPRKQLTEFDATFTFNADGYPIFDQNNWATYRAAMKEDKPPPGSSTKELRLSTEAAYLARKTLVLTEEFFRLRYNTAITLTEGKLDIRTYARREFFKEEQHVEYVNIMELREVARDILLRRSTTERRACPEWLNCWVYGSELVRRHHPGKPHAYPNTKQTLNELNAWLATLPPQDLLPVYMVQIASWFADATAWQMESRQRHGTCIIPSAQLLTEFPTVLSASASIGDAANVWCLPPSPLWWSNAMIHLQEPLRAASAQMAAKGLSLRLKAPPFVPVKGARPQRPREYWPEKNFKWPNVKDPRPAWRPLPKPDYHLKDNLQYPCSATAIASIAHCHSFMFLLRLTWTEDGWMDTSVGEDPLDDDAYHTHLADLDLDR